MFRFLWTTFFGVAFVFSMALMVVGFMFLLRVCLVLWFDIDFSYKINAWLCDYKDIKKKEHMREDFDE